MAIFAVHYQYADQPEAVAAAKPEHRAYLARLLDGDKLAASGAFLDANEGLLILKADDQAGAEALIAADPINRAGLVAKITINHWSPTLGPFAEG
ncbi:MAG: YciI family protein [Bifidobacteriaceae bacterium]|jgi:uncharacterized protein YciI|nr:YciI family protein [Bifidobacteriaceae bacterium]